jgi:hypothetical protein
MRRDIDSASRARRIAPRTDEAEIAAAMSMSEGVSPRPRPDSAADAAAIRQFETSPTARRSSMWRSIPTRASRAPRAHRAAQRLARAIVELRIASGRFCRSTTNTVTLAVGRDRRRRVARVAAAQAIARLRSRLRESLQYRRFADVTDRHPRRSGALTEGTPVRPARRRCRLQLPPPDRVSDQIRSLHFLHDLRPQRDHLIAAFLRTTTEISIVSVEQFAYSEFLMAIPTRRRSTRWRRPMRWAPSN